MNLTPSEKTRLWNVTRALERGRTRLSPEEADVIARALRELEEQQ